MRTRLIACFGALLALFGSPVSAGVIYRWQDITPNSYTGPFMGEIEFSYDAWSPGGHISQSGQRGSTLDPLFGIERFYWSNPSELGFVGHIETTEGPCSDFVKQGLDYDCAALGLPDERPVFFPITGGGPVVASFDLTFGALLQGAISINDSSTEVHMGSSGPLFTIERTGSDNNNSNCINNDGRCWGSTGIWVLDLATLPPVRVPEPSPTALMLIGLAALVAYRTRLDFTRTTE